MDTIEIVLIGVIIYYFLKLSGGIFRGLGRSSEESKDEDEEEEEDYETCSKCGAKVDEDYDYECVECGNYFCRKCLVYFENVDNLCKDCIDKAYPRESPKKEKVYFRDEPKPKANSEFSSLKENLESRRMIPERKVAKDYEKDQISKDYLTETKFEDTKFD